MIGLKFILSICNFIEASFQIIKQSNSIKNQIYQTDI